MSMAKSTTRPKRRKAQNTTYEAHVDVPDHLAPLASNDRIPIQIANPTHAIDDGLSLIEIAQHIAHAVGINTQRHAQRICELPTPCESTSPFEVQVLENLEPHKLETSQSINAKPRCQQCMHELWMSFFPELCSLSGSAAFPLVFHF